MLFSSLIFSQETPKGIFKNIGDKLNERIEELENGLIKKDTASLKNILHSSLTLGHSNGWTETKNSLLENLPTSKVVYTKITSVEPSKISIIEDRTATVRRLIHVTGVYENMPFDVDLNVLEVWIYEDERWQLLARQSVEVDFDD